MNGHTVEPKNTDIVDVGGGEKAGFFRGCDR